MEHTPHTRRRGVIILIVLCLLVLFSLIAVSFAIVAGQYLRSARAANRLEQHGDPPSVLLDMAVYQVLTGNDVLIALSARSIGATVVTQNEEQEAEALLKRIPFDYLTIFQHPLFARFAWTSRLLSQTAATDNRPAPPRG